MTSHNKNPLKQLTRQAEPLPSIESIDALRKIAFSWDEKDINERATWRGKSLRELRDVWGKVLTPQIKAYKNGNPSRLDDVFGMTYAKLQVNRAGLAIIDYVFLSALFDLDADNKELLFLANKTAKWLSQLDTQLDRISLVHHNIEPLLYLLEKEGFARIAGVDEKTQLRLRRQQILIGRYSIQDYLRKAKKSASIEDLLDGFIVPSDIRDVLYTTLQDKIPELAPLYQVWLKDRIDDVEHDIKNNSKRLIRNTYLTYALDELLAVRDKRWCAVAKEFYPDEKLRLDKLKLDLELYNRRLRALRNN